MSKRKDKLAERVFRGFANFMKYERELKRRMGWHRVRPAIFGLPLISPKIEIKEYYSASDYYKKEWKESCVNSWYDGLHLDLFKEE